jgi:hypothetical protein
MRYAFMSIFCRYDVDFNVEFYLNQVGHFFSRFDIPKSMSIRLSFSNWVIIMYTLQFAPGFDFMYLREGPEIKSF